MRQAWKREFGEVDEAEAVEERGSLDLEKEGIIDRGAAAQFEGEQLRRGFNEFFPGGGAEYSAAFEANAAIVPCNEG